METSEEKLQSVICSMENILTNTQEYIEQYNQQQTKLYWNSVKMYNNRHIWGDFIDMEERLKEFAGAMIRYTEEIQKLARIIIDDVLELQKKLSCDGEAPLIYEVERKVVIMRDVQKEYWESVKAYSNHVAEMDRLMRLHLEQTKQSRERKGRFEILKDRVKDFFNEID